MRDWSCELRIGPGCRFAHPGYACCHQRSSVRGNPNLYAKLARALKEAGVPGAEYDATEAGS